MKEVRKVIEINASKDRVWNILTDFSSYPKWNPFLVQVETKLSPGSPVAMKAQVGARTMNVDATILEASPYKLVWAGPISKFRGILFRGEHHFEIEEVSPGRVRSSTSSISGAYCFPLWVHLPKLPFSLNTRK